MKRYLNIFMVLLILMLFAFSKEKENIEPKTPTIDLGALDSLKCVYHWEVQNDTLKIWTVNDEINNELERLKYLKENFYE